MIRYHKTQYGTGIIVMLGLAIVACLMGAKVTWQNYYIMLNPMASMSVLLAFALLLFYKLTIEIDEQTITARLGIGLIKREARLMEIERESIRKVNVPWYYGTGLRFTPQGILFNVNFGSAIHFRAAGKNFFVGTDEFEIIKSILKNDGDLQKG